MKVKSDLLFVKAAGGKKEKDDGIQYWCRLTLITPDTHDIFELFASPSSAEDVFHVAETLDYGQVVFATLDIQPNFKKDGYRISCYGLEV